MATFGPIPAGEPEYGSCPEQAYAGEHEANVGTGRCSRSGAVRLANDGLRKRPAVGCGERAGCLRSGRPL
jgi:hypothetical protein